MGLDVAMRVENVSALQMDEINERLRDQIMSTDAGNAAFEFLDGSWSLDTMWRYWGPNYERGPWFMIAGVICTVWAVEPAARIFYGSDCDRTIPLMTPERCRHFWEHFAGPDGLNYRKNI